MANSTSKAGPLRTVFALTLLFGPALFLIFISTRGCEHKFKQLEDFGKIPQYSFTDASGKKYTNASFNNKIVIYTTLQPGCPDSCAVSTWQIDQQIYQHLRLNKKKLGHVKLVSFVTDGKGNQSDRLADVAATLKDQVQEYDPSIWILAKGDARQLYNLKHNGTSLLQKGSKYFGGEAYQELMLLVDKRNHLRMVLSGKTESMVRTMKQDLALLEKQYDLDKARKKK
jgi:cytochrome oxidase Cu insertion factor (SCO1/SenC/PrrC family)